MMNMDMGTDNSTTVMMMGTAFTTSLGSANLWFVNWTPTTAASTFAASFGLFLLAILSRLLSAVRTSAESAWSQSIAMRRSASRLGITAFKGGAEATKSSSLPDSISYSSPSSTSPPPSFSSSPSLHQAPPFIASIDIPRSIIFMFQAFVGYLLMLAVMTYDAWFFVAIILGLGVGEMVFGRYSSGNGHSSGVHL